MTRNISAINEKYSSVSVEIREIIKKIVLYIEKYIIATMKRATFTEERLSEQRLKYSKTCA